MAIPLQPVQRLAKIYILKFAPLAILFIQDNRKSLIVQGVWINSAVATVLENLVSLHNPPVYSESKIYLGLFEDGKSSLSIKISWAGPSKSSN
ncbi:hypothetical protein THIOM_003182 [Candidatus Thiomargarita nelsonii]|uniref:Uncharacterized protein n=1 Tax=Candidatus Thiomargarita nelsonii TaxID=1003181 RepID=A0A176RZE8_9GAMM|nr:hypothetical protein THIOM_003182 [Candidatus Thiomargarita nelsonii]